MNPPEPGPIDPQVFDEPWQAEAFALVVHLHDRGAFTWTEWADALTAEIGAVDARSEPDDGSQYFHQWLAALERLALKQGLAEPEALAIRKEAWADAYRQTPHGRPVVLGA